MKKVAVYGSLLSGLGNHRLLETSTLVMNAEIAIPFKMIDLGAFPGLVTTEENQNITVEIYEVEDDIFARLDRLEGYPNFYDRYIIPPIENINDIWIYFLADDNYQTQVVPSGDWKTYLKLKRKANVLSEY